jgi:hypothetical protein
LGAEEATETKGAAAMAAMGIKTPLTTVDRETASTTRDTRAGGRKAAAADTAGDKTGADTTAGATRKTKKNCSRNIFLLFFFFLRFAKKNNGACNSFVPQFLC